MRRASLHLFPCPILQRLSGVYGPDLLHARQISDGPRQLEGAMEGAGGQMQLLHRRFEQTLRAIVRLAVFPHLARAHVGIADQGRAGEAHASRRYVGPGQATLLSPTPWRSLSILAIGGLP